MASSSELKSFAENLTIKLVSPILVVKGKSIDSDVGALIQDAGCNDLQIVDNYVFVTPSPKRRKLEHPVRGLYRSSVESCDAVTNSFDVSDLIDAAQGIIRTDSDEEFDESRCENFLCERIPNEKNILHWHRRFFSEPIDFDKHFTFMKNIKNLDERFKNICNSDDVKSESGFMSREYMMDTYGYYIHNATVCKFLKKNLSDKIMKKQDELRVIRRARKEQNINREVALREEREKRVNSIKELFDPKYIYEQADWLFFEAALQCEQKDVILTTHFSAKEVYQQDVDKLTVEWKNARDDLLKIEFLPKRNAMLDSVDLFYRRKKRVLKRVFKKNEEVGVIKAEVAELATPIPYVFPVIEYVNTKAKSFDYRYMLRGLMPKFVECAEYMDVFGPFIDLIYRIYRSRNIADIGMAIYSFLDRTVSKIVTSKGLMSILAETFVDLIDDYTFVGFSDEIRAESASDVIGHIRTFIDKYLTNSIMLALRNTLLTVMSLRIFSKDLAFKMYGFLGKPQKMDFMELFPYLLKQVETLVKFGEFLCGGASWDVALLQTDPHLRYSEKVRQLLSYAESTYSGLPVPGQMCQRLYVAESNQLIAVGTAIMAKMSPRMSERTIIHKELIALRKAHESVEMMFIKGRRDHPLGLIFEGFPGVGKSVILECALQEWSAVKGRVYHPDQMYTRVANSDYWDGYNRFAKPFIHYSEAGSIHENIVKVQGDKQFAEITQVMDSLQMIGNTAFGDKGKLLIDPELVVVDTNNASLNLHLFVNNEAAYRRRFIYVQCKVKQEFKDDLGCGIDPEKSLAAGGDPTDRYLFGVYLLKPIDNKQSYKQELLSVNDPKSDIYALRRVLKERFTSHISLTNKTNTVVTGHLDALGLTMISAPKVEIITAEAGTVDPKIKFTETKFDRVKREVEFGFKWVGFLVSLTMLTFFKAMVSSSSGNEPPKNSFWNWFFHLGVSSGIGLFSVFVSMFVGVPAGVMWTTYVFTRRMCNFMGSIQRQIVKLYLEEQIHTYQQKFSLLNLDKPLSNPFESKWWIRNRVNVGKFSEMLICVLGVTGMGIAIGTTINNYAKKKKNKGTLGKPHSWAQLQDGKWYELMLDKHGNEIIVSETEMNKTIYDEDYERLIYPEAHTDFQLPSDVNKSINDFEEQMSCGNSYQRIPIKGKTDQWNIITRSEEQCVHKGDLESLSKRFSSNVRASMLVYEDGRRLRTFLIGVQGSFALINTHALTLRNKVLLRVSITGSVGGQDEIYKDTIIDSSNRKDLGNDVSLVRLQGMEFKDNLKHFGDGNFPLDTYVGRFYQRPLEVHMPKKEIVIVTDMGKIKIDPVAAYIFPEHKPGCCGTPLFIEKNSGSCIAGFHAGGKDNSDFGFAALFKSADIIKGMNDILNKSNLFEVYSKGDLRVEGLLLPVPKSPFNHIPLHGISYFGRVPGPITINGKSSLVKAKCETEIMKVMYDQLGFIPSTIYDKPMMAPSTINGEFISPFNIALTSISKQKGVLDMTIVEDIVEKLSRHIVRGLREKGVPSLAPLTLKSAINGMKHDAFIRRINTSTSAGFGLSGKKSEYLPIVEERDDEVIREPIFSEKQKINAMLQAYVEKSTFRRISVGLLKDEPRSVEKVKLGKTRMFYSSDLTSLQLSRMLLAPFFSLMVEHSEVFGCSIGINMHAGADKYVNEMTSFSKYILEGDFSSFDTSIPSEISHAVMSVIVKVLSEMGYSEFAIKMLKGLFSDALFPNIIVNQDIFEAAGQIVSGNYATAEMNCLICLVIMMYVWYTQPNLKHKDFFSYVKCGNYGDDLGAAVKPSELAFFNNFVIQKVCKEVMLMDYTSSSKTLDLMRSCNITQCTFLKRNFRKRDDLERWVAPLSLDSLYKSLVWILPSKSVSLREQMLSTYESFCWELLLHVPKKKHDLIRQLLEKIFSQYYGAGGEVKLPTFEAIESAMF